MSVERRITIFGGTTMNNGTFANFLDSLRTFESGVSVERIAQNRAEVIRQVGQDRLDAFEAGDLTLTDLQYSSENFLGFVGYQFGEPILIDLGYYEFDSTPGTNDFSGNFTGKNGVNSLDDLKTNIQETIILDEFQLNLTRIETGLANAGSSLDEFIGQTTTATDTDGSETTVELSLTGILASAHLRGAFGTLDFLLNSVASADEIGTSNVQFIEQFGGFDAPTVTQLTSGVVAPLATDATLTIDRPFGDGVGSPAAGSDQPVPPVVIEEVSEPTPSAVAAPEPAPVAADPPAPTLSATANPDAGVPDAPAGVPTAPAAAQTREFDRATGNFLVTGTDGVDGSAYGENGDDIIRTFGGDDSSVAFAGDDFQDLGAGNDRAYGLSGNDTILGGSGDYALNGGTGNDVLVGGRDNDQLRGGADADRFVFAAGDGADVVKDFVPGEDVLDFTDVGANPAVQVSQTGANAIVSVGDVRVTLEGVNSTQLTARDFLGAVFGDVAQAPEPTPTPEPPTSVPPPASPPPSDGGGGGEPQPSPAPVFSDAGVPELPAGAPAAVSPVFLRTFDATRGTFTVTGTDGIDSSAYGFTGDDIIRTFGGNDSSVGFEGNDFQELGDGDDRGWGLEGDDTLLGGAGNDIWNGDEGDARGTGIESGSDVLVGGRGDDILRGDTIDTNTAADRFVFSAGDGNDIVRDFQTGLDTLDVSEFDDGVLVRLEEQGGNTIVTVGDVTITLESVDADDLTDRDFIGARFNADEPNPGSTASTLTTDDSLIA